MPPAICRLIRSSNKSKFHTVSLHKVADSGDHDLVVFLFHAILRGFLCKVPYLLIGEEKVNGIGEKKLVQGQYSRSLVAITKNMAACDGEKQAGGLVVNRGIKLLIPSAGERLRCRRLQQIEIQAVEARNWFHGRPGQGDSKIMDGFNVSRRKWKSPTFRQASSARQSTWQRIPSSRSGPSPWGKRRVSCPRALNISQWPYEATLCASLPSESWPPPSKYPRYEFDAAVTSEASKEMPLLWFYRPPAVMGQGCAEMRPSSQPVRRPLQIGAKL